MIDNRRMFRYFDWVSFLLIICLVSIGLLFVYSATYHAEKSLSIFFKKQVFGVCSGLILYIVACKIQPNTLVRIGFIGYIITGIALCYTIASGWLAMGARRWISFYVVRIQPSEMVKLCLPAFFGYLWREQGKVPSYILPLVSLSITFVLILKQPDLGTGLVILLVGLTLLWHKGLPRSIFIGMFVGSLLLSPVLWQRLHTYQKKRILVLLGYGDAQGSRYQIQQSKIAIGSGQLTGKGYLKGTINKLSYVPEDHTDFIFAVIAEEWGFLGGLFIIILFTTLFTRLLVMISWLKDGTDQTVALGLLLPIIASTIVNIGMVIGMLPIVGIPLPLCSYGISNMWVTLASLGWIQSITMRRFW